MKWNEHTILQLVNQITEALSQVKFTLGIFIDLSKAFDTINLNILLEKLKVYEIQSKNLKWLGGYLSRGKQLVSYNGF